LVDIGSSPIRGFPPNPSLPMEVLTFLRCCQRALYHLYTNRQNIFFIEEELGLEIKLSLYLNYL
jgi:hypothetical protein